jgi:rare lipoprotein A (peptidoglycan hydrolase)
VRHLRVVASVALIASLATVAVPDPAWSRAQLSLDRPDTDLFQQVEIAAAVRGTSMTTEAPDPGDRSAGNLDQGSTLFEPSQRTEPPQARPRTAQPVGKAVAVERNPWRLDRNISWYGPGLYGNGTACGQTLTKGLVGVAHRTLPCGTKVEFRNPKNGRVVAAQVIDRGPFVSGRTWDLSHGLCAKLKHCYTGSIEWRYATGD